MTHSTAQQSLSDPKQTYVRPLRKRLRKALEILAERGCTLKEAAESAGMRPNSLTVALGKVHVREELDRILRARMQVEKVRSWGRVVELRDSSVSDDVKLKAARTVLGAAGELEPEMARQQAPSQLIQIIIPPSQSTGAPYMERPGVITAPPLDWIEGQAEERPQAEPSGPFVFGASR